MLNDFLRCLWLRLFVCHLNERRELHVRAMHLRIGFYDDLSARCQIVLKQGNPALFADHYRQRMKTVPPVFMQYDDYLFPLIFRATAVCVKKSLSTLS